MGLAELASTESEQAQLRQWVTLMGTTAFDLDQIIKDLSKILDIKNGMDNYLEPVILEAEWKQSLSLLQDNLEGSEQILSDFSGCPKLISVRAMIQSIFYNLLSNAIKFRSPNRALVVKASSRAMGNKSIIEVSDNGLGINMARYREKLFQLYWRFHTHVQGRGMGLYLIRSQVEVLHGSIEVESEPDAGTRFIITLPMHIESQSQLESAPISKSVSG